MRLRCVSLPVLVAVLVAPALADDLGEKIRAVFDRAKGNLVRVKFDQPMPEHGLGGGGGSGTRKASITGFAADEETVVVVSSSLSMFGGLGGVVRMAISGGDAEDLGGEVEEEEPSGFKAVLPDGTEVPLELRKKDPETGFAFLRLRKKEDAGSLRRVVFATSEPPLADPVVVVNFGGADMDHQPRFLLTRLNGVFDRGFPVYSTMEPVGDYQGGLVYDLKGDLVGVVAPPPRAARPKREKDSEGGVTGAITVFMDASSGGSAHFGRGGARVLSGKWVSQALRTMEKKPAEAR